MNERESTPYNQIIGIANGEIVVLEETFEYPDDFSGAIGYTMSQLYQDQIGEGRDPENLRDLWENVVAGGGTTMGFDDWAEEAIENADLAERTYFPTDDPSSRREMDEAYAKLTAEQQEQLDKAFGKIGEDFVDWDISSTGRCIPTRKKDYSLLLNPDLLEIAKEAEKGRTKGR